MITDNHLPDGATASWSCAWCRQLIPVTYRAALLTWAGDYVEVRPDYLVHTGCLQTWVNASLDELRNFENLTKVLNPTVLAARLQAWDDTLDQLLPAQLVSYVTRWQEQPQPEKT